MEKYTVDVDTLVPQTSYKGILVNPVTQQAFMEVISELWVDNSDALQQEFSALRKNFVSPKYTGDLDLYKHPYANQWSRQNLFSLLNDPRFVESVTKKIHDNVRFTSSTYEEEITFAQVAKHIRLEMAANPDIWFEDATFRKILPAMRWLYSFDATRNLEADAAEVIAACKKFLCESLSTSDVASYNDFIAHAQASQELAFKKDALVKKWEYAFHHRGDYESMYTSMIAVLSSSELKESEKMNLFLQDLPRLIKNISQYDMQSYNHGAAEYIVGPRWLSLEQFKEILDVIVSDSNKENLYAAIAQQFTVFIHSYTEDIKRYAENYEHVRTSWGAYHKLPKDWWSILISDQEWQHRLSNIEKHQEVATKNKELYESYLATLSS